MKIITDTVSSSDTLPLFDTEQCRNHFGFRNRVDIADEVQRLPDAANTRGLLVRDPYATQLLNGEKQWEIRGRATQIRGPVVIIKSGTGHAFGVVQLVDVLGPLTLEDLTESTYLTAAEREEFRSDGLPYKKTYAYVVRTPRWFKSPRPYNHPYGAVTWVNLPGIDLQKVRYAPSAPQSPSQLPLV